MKLAIEMLSSAPFAIEQAAVLVRRLIGSRMPIALTADRASAAWQLTCPGRQWKCAIRVRFLRPAPQR
jgi:hypothetical protein